MDKAQKSVKFFVKSDKAMDKRTVYGFEVVITNNEDGNGFKHNGFNQFVSNIVETGKRRTPSQIRHIQFSYIYHLWPEIMPIHE